MRGRGGSAPALLAAALVLPCGYGGFLIHYGEALAAPRPFAEALTLLALAALVDGRAAAAASLLVAASAVHPIMALPGWGVLLIMQGRDDRRWFMAAAAGALVLVAAGAVGAPVAGRLFHRLDAEWLRVLDRRAPFLFLRAWPPEAWARAAVQAATVGAAARLAAGRMRALLLAALATAAAALSASAGLGDGLHGVLAVQLQPWRALWLTAFLAAASAPLVVRGLWARGPAGRLAAAALLVAWTATETPALALPAAAAGLALAAHAARGGTAPAWLARAGGAAALAVTGGFAWLQISATPLFCSATCLSPHLLALSDAPRVLAAAAGLATAAALSGGLSGRDLRRAALWGGALLLLAGVAGWDVRPPGRRLLDDPAARAAVRALVAVRPGAVLWLGGDVQPWLLAGRPAWRSELQGASVVFSRGQALAWEARTRRLAAEGVAPPTVLGRYPASLQAALWTPDPVRLARFCGEADAPAWVVAPYAGARVLGRPGAPSIVWRAPQVDAVAPRPGAAPLAVDRYAFIPCGGDRP